MAVINPSSSSSSNAKPSPLPPQLLLLFLHLLLVVPATSLTFSYDDHSFVSDDFRQEDDAMVTAGRIELLGEEFAARARGRALYKLPVQLWDGATGEEASFAASFNFTIRSVAGRSNGLAGHGMTFFLAPFMPDMPQECYEGCLGLFDQSMTKNLSHAMGNATGAASFVAVELDTHKDGWDPSGRHIGVDVNNVDSHGNYRVLPDDSLVDAGVMSATVAYDSGTRRLDVALAVGGAMYNLSAAVDLRSVLPEQVAVGFSAATGDEFASNHTVLSCTFSSTLPTRTHTSPPSTSSAKRAHLSAAVAAAGAALLILLTVTVAVLILYASKRRRGGGKHHTLTSDGDDSLGAVDDEDFESGTGPRAIPYAHLEAATSDFAEGGKLGQGGSGSVYGGHVRELGRDVAIKVFTRGATMEGRKEYRSEVTVISRLRHRNLVQLIGWCHGRRRLLLVYELVRNGSLDGHLYSNDETLTWPLRYQIILGLASAVLYLHQEWDQCVVHGDIKPSNIMLDESFNAKLGDFGLARLFDHGMSLQTMTAVAGTPGYLDPECVITGKASTESDMYSFGVVLLEVACGRRPMTVAPRAAAATGGGNDDDGGGQVFRLVEWAWELYGRGVGAALDVAADARLGGAFDRWEMERVVGVGLWCAHPDPKARPAIRQAAEALQLRKFRMPVLPPRMPVAVYLQPSAASTMKYYGDSMTSVGSEVVAYSSTTSLATVTQSSSSSFPPAMADTDSLNPRE